MRKQLTEVMIEKHAPPPAGRVEIFDTIVPALALRITSNGAKSFVVRARIRGESSPIRVTIGDARGMKLADARTRASEVLRTCRAGEDPRPKPVPVSTPPETSLWENVVATFIDKHAKPKNKSWKHTEALIAQRVTPHWRGKLITEITRHDVVAVLDLAEKTSVYRANRVLAAIRKLFNWAVLRGLLDTSPIVAGMARKGEISRERFLTFEELRLVWRGAERLGQPFGPLFKFLTVTGQRRGEVTNAQWASFDLDPQRLWTLTSEETKAARSHIVPLSDLALEIINDQPRIDDPDLAEELRLKGSNQSAAVYVFTTTGSTSLSGFSKAKRQLDAAILEIMRENANSVGLNPNAVEPMKQWRVHDLRRSAATHMEDALGVPPHIVGTVLNHAPASYKGVTAVYTRGPLVFERRRALVAWARLLRLAIEGGAVWPSVARILRPETEGDAARLDEFRQMARADEEGWNAYVARLASAALPKAA